jgi:hypothetical protein
MKVVYFIPLKSIFLESNDLEYYLLKTVYSILTFNYLFNCEFEIYSDFDGLSIFSEIFPYNLNLNFTTNQDDFLKDNINNECVLMTNKIIDVKSLEKLEAPFSFILKKEKDCLSISDHWTINMQKCDLVSELNFYFGNNLNKFREKISKKIKILTYLSEENFLS